MITNMKLFLTATSERGKSVTKSGNERLYTEISFERRGVAHININKSPTLGDNVYILSVSVNTDTGIKQIETVLHSTELKTVKELCYCLCHKNGNKLCINCEKCS